jgi:hypothetical protein
MTNMTQNNNQIPEGWIDTTLGEVIYPVSETFKFRDGQMVHFLNTGDILDKKTAKEKIDSLTSLKNKLQKEKGGTDKDKTFHRTT